MEEQAQVVANKYGRALLLFAKCHNSFNSSLYFDDAALSTLLCDIDTFVSYYRGTMGSTFISSYTC
ncbi:hypothetical protein GBAR_LOCUS11611 [Geodia barretti]|uniref:Uncharacterized protein n=1 Tax=Geodia barretti TaxID=519541 RepID=A0AA35RZV6_GEOBA|nr:hypothetical protein GBAR_LOCUS11611 [Geodia barretti]